MTSQVYLRQVLIPAQCALSSPVLRALAIHLSDALTQTTDATEEMCETALRQLLWANGRTDCGDLAECLKRLRDAGWKFSQGDAG